MNHNQLRDVAYHCLLDLATDEGINASGRDEIYGCIFGRDSAITILKILNVCRDGVISVDTARLLAICRRSLLTLTSLQGRTLNIESGEEAGKFIHEFRRDKYDHLLTLPQPWYLYPDRTLRNYDSLDSTPLALIAIYRYYELTHDTPFIKAILPAVKRGLAWMLTAADHDNDRLAEYEFRTDRQHGGLVVQSWTDSGESLMRPDGTFPHYPIAPVEVQGYFWLACRLWADYFQARKKSIYAAVLNRHARLLKKKFNKYFMFQDGGLWYAAQALDGDKNQIRTITGNPLLLLWATYMKGKRESILEDRFVRHIVKRAFEPDMFDPDAGVRTMSKLSPTYDASQNSYHNGSFWPKLNGMAHEGLAAWGYHKEADLLKEASLRPLIFFGSPIELYTKDAQGGYVEFRSPTGQVSCRNQAWSAAAALDLLTD